MRLESLTASRCIQECSLYGRFNTVLFGELQWMASRPETIRYLVDPASSHMLVPKIKPCMSKYKQVYTVKLRMAHYISYNLFDSLFTTWITVVILELIHA